MYARRFLYVFAAVIVLVIAGAFVYRLFPGAIFRAALVPTVKFEKSPHGSGPNYATLSAWDAHPGLPADAARWLPTGVAAAGDRKAAVFFVTPTAYLGRDRWNMPFGDSAADARIVVYLKGEASVFNGIGEIWAPRYRQAAFGAFFTAKPDAQRAIDLAYSDVLRAWQEFIAAQPPGRPIILAAHSQGSLHLMRLLREHLKGTPVMPRIVAAYIIGWPISVTADLPALGLPACDTPYATGCIVAFQSFAEPADATLLRAIFDAQPGYTGASRKGDPVLCTNPLLGMPSTEEAPPVDNLGALEPDAALSGGKLVPGHIPATCDAQGLLLIGTPPEGFGDYVLPGNNYHVYDYALFWANLRQDAERRFAAMPEPPRARRVRRR